MVDAQDVERRRLERELNEGAQQQVVALKVQLGLAEQQAHAEGADTAASLIAQMAGETQDAIDQIRPAVEKQIKFFPFQMFFH